jgi:uncharacterized protein
MIIVDTGFWVALANKRDQHHEIAKQCLQKMATDNVSFITTCAVMTEVSYLLYQRIGREAQRKFLTHYQNGLFTIFEIGAEHAPQINSLMDKYVDLPMDFADASLVILAEHLGHGRILSTDLRDFHTYRWKNHYPFENLLLP